MPYTPDGVGFRPTDTSQAAADDIRQRAQTIRLAVLDFLRTATSPKSTEEVAEAVGMIYASVQPRISELRNANLIEDSGMRGKSRYGKSCILWKATNQDKGHV